MSDQGSMAVGSVTGTRERLWDVCRGAAILGTLATNIWIFGYAEAYGEADLAFEESGWLATAVTALSNGKFLSLLCLLVGVGIGLQSQRAEAAGAAWPGPAIRRYLVLGFFGLLHALLVFMFDVLTGYAVAAILVCLWARSDTKTLKTVWSVFAALHVMIAMGYTLLLGGIAFLAEFSDSSRELLGKFLSGMVPGDWSLGEQFMQRVDGLLWKPAAIAGELPTNLMLMLAGLLLARHRSWFLGEEGRHRRRSAMIFGLGVGLPASVLAGLPLSEWYAFAGSVVQRMLLGPFVALGYLAVIIEGVERGWLTWITMRLAEVGRCAMSCYVLQNLLASIVFYSWGLGLTDDANDLTIVSVLVALTLMQAALSFWWVTVWGLGPLEMLWRRLARVPAVPAPGVAT